MPPPDMPETQRLPFAPVPTQYQVIPAQVGADQQVLLICTTQMGALGYFMTSEVAEQLAGFLHQHATAIASGLTIIGDVGGIPDEHAL